MSKEEEKEDYARPKIKREDHAKMRDYAYFQKADLTEVYHEVIEKGLAELKKSEKKKSE